MGLCRYLRNGAAGWGWIRGETVTPLNEADVVSALASPTEAGLRSLETVSGKQDAVDIAPGDLLAPLLPTQEVWAAGVTYESSKFARMAESEAASDLYARVYVADRPELFFKATSWRTVGPGQPLRIRSDAHWNVPEPELAVLLAADGRILGYTVGNDMSSRDIEGENALYLPQAKVYRACCGLGPVVIPADAVDAHNLAIRLTISRDGAVVFEGETSTSQMRRTVKELAGWLFRENDFPHGVFMLTGTGIVPPETFTLLSGDQMSISIKGVGVLTNMVE